MMADRDARHDIVLDSKGYMLARKQQMGRGGHVWKQEAIGSSIARTTPTEMLYGNQPATVEIPMVYRSAHLGYGDELQVGEGRYRYAQNIDARFPLTILPGPYIKELTVSGSANVNGFFEQGGKLFCLAGHYCKEIQSNDVIALDKDFGVGKVAVSAAVYNGIAYVGMGYSEPFWKRAANESWSQAVGLYMGYIAPFKDRLWASVSQYLVASVSADPTISTNWAASYKIGGPGTAITALGELGQLLYTGKEDGLYALDSSGVAQKLTPELSAYQNPTNCMNMCAWHGLMWIPHIRGLITYRKSGDDFVVIPATPGTDIDIDNPVRGQITAMAGDNRWLYMAMLTADGDTYILAGRTAQGDEQTYGLMIWHPLARLASKEVHAMHLSGLRTNPCLFMGIGANAGYIVLPRHGDNPLQDTNCRYQTFGSIYFPAHSWGTPTTTKIWKSIEIMANNLGLTRYIEIYYKIDDGGWTYAGKVTLSGNHVLALPDEGVAGNKIAFRLDYTLPNNQSWFALRNLVVRGVERPKTIDLITMVVRCADRLPLRGGRGYEERTGAEILADLQALAASDKAVILKGLVGEERYVVVQSAIPNIVEIESEGDLARELLVTISMSEFSADESTTQEVEYAIYGTTLYGDGSVYA